MSNLKPRSGIMTEAERHAKNIKHLTSADIDRLLEDLSDSESDTSTSSSESSSESDSSDTDDNVRQVTSIYPIF